jgi:NAD(P)-dependent dehydrogenase (short-subunit alcohol dehydrogenase family)
MDAELLSGKVAVVTAGGSGMGRRACLRLAEAGAHVVVTDLEAAAAEDVAAEIATAGSSAEAYPADVTDLDQLRLLADRVRRTHGAVHILFNHAGLPGPPGLDITPEQWTRTVDVNARGAFFMTSFFLEALRAADGASVIFTSSVVGVVGSQFSPLYSLVKGGLVALVRALALNLAPDKIRANAICPGPTETPMLPQFLGAGESDEVVELRKQAILAGIPAGRLATADDIAETVVFLASDAASYITGVSLPVDGGFTAR